MNPRIQVEHTVSEVITGIDIVQAQILIAEGYALDSKAINIKSQDDVKIRRSMLSSAVSLQKTLQMSFAPDTGKIEFYSTGSGNGIRLDGGNGFTGAIITPYYDSLLVKDNSLRKRFQRCCRTRL